ncbi:MAG: hypothetical protein ACRD68_17765 [Pyrinomonadaceae bacterium]
MRLKSALVLTVAVAMLTGFGGALASRASSLAATPAAATPFVGAWRTTWKNADGSTASAPVAVKADSVETRALDGVIEMNGPNGAMYGSLSSDGKTWSGDWWNSKGEKGTFTFTLKGNKSFEGSYTLAGATGDFSWSGTK